jgi:hypothetical protein
MMTDDVRRSLGPAERWYWIADHSSSLNVFAHVHLTDHISCRLLTRSTGNLAAERLLLRMAIRAEADGTNPSTRRAR